MNNYWELNEVDVNLLVNDIKKKKVTIPSFQRGVVWNDKKRELLIESMKNGYPFGSLLIYEDEDGKKQLIDGLQRSMTMYGFLTNPAFYFNENDIDPNVISKIIELAGYPGSKEEIKKKLYLIIQNEIKMKYQTMSELQNLQIYSFASAISKEHPILKGKEETIMKLIEPFLLNFKEKCGKLSFTKIPAIIFHGDAQALPIIFERINKEGVKLNKYQIYAASWTNSIRFKIDNVKLKKILNYVAERYDALGKLEGLNSIIYVDDYNSSDFKNKGEVNTFELGYGFGKLLIEKFPELFNSSNTDNMIDSVGFNIINACLGQKNSKMSRLHLELKKFDNQTINMFLDKIIECTEQVNSILEPFSKFKGNKRSSKKFNIAHTELQIVSIIASLMLIKYGRIEKNEFEDLFVINYSFEQSNTEWKEINKDFKQNVRIYYLLDIINQRWKGTGDKTLDSIIYNPKYYCNHYPKESLVTDLKSWYQRDKLNRNERDKIKEPKDLEKLLLNVVYLNEFKAIDQLDESKYDIEHLCPKELMKNKLKHYPHLSLPLSSIGNLCLLPEYQNRAKKDKTIYEDASYKKTINVSEVEKKFAFTTEENMNFLFMEINAEKFKEAYEKFIDERFEIIIEKIASALY